MFSIQEKTGVFFWLLCMYLDSLWGQELEVVLLDPNLRQVGRNIEILSKLENQLGKMGLADAAQTFDVSEAIS